MFIRGLVLLLIIFSACTTGRIPCPTVKADKLKKTHIKKRIRYAERDSPATASIKGSGENNRPRTTPSTSRIIPTKPALEHMNVEEWDCPKPGGKKNIPKALKDNIRKNKKAYEDYYKSRNSADSLSSSRLP
jgi:hypothetical protein